MNNRQDPDPTPGRAAGPPNQPARPKAAGGGPGGLLAPVKRRPAPAQQSGGSGGDSRRRSRNHWFTAILMVMATVFGCVFLALFLLQSAYDMFGLNQSDFIVEVTVPEATTVADVAALLGDEGVIDHPATFRLYLWFKDVKDTDIVAATYPFNANMSYNEIIDDLGRGFTEREEIRLFFPEGMTLLEIARELEAARVCDAEEFIQYLNNEANFNFEFLGAIEYEPLRYHKLEGYLFPDTYDFFIGEAVRDVALKFLRNFNDRITPAHLARMQELNLTIDETVILASIIQKEAGLRDDMKLVSSVFHNRLDDPGNFPNLQSDVTILYVEDNIKNRLQVANQRMYDAYNTYVREGLPVGAVCNPGLDAIEAVLYPETTAVKFYYFVTDIDMNFYYAATLDAHQRNISAAEAAGGEAHGIGTQ